MSMLRILLLAAFVLCIVQQTQAEPGVAVSPVRVDEKQGLDWRRAQDIGLSGQGWANTKAPFDRLPAKAEKIVRRPVWSLSRHSAGIHVHFTTNSPKISVRWKLIGKNLAMPHMPATGVSGVDLYVRWQGKWRWLANGRPTKWPVNEQEMVAGLSPENREYLLFLPLYNGVSEVEIGVAAGSQIERTVSASKKKKLPIVFWGTSITQGGCASRPGMVHTAILARRLDRETINLGFSGNGKMELEMAGLLAEIEAAVYVLDCLPNLNAKEVAERTEPVVRILRAAHPYTPILLVEDRNYPNGFLVASRRIRNATDQAALRGAFERLQAAGVGDLFYLEGEKLLGPDGEDTVDGSHPTDLGFVRMADAFEKVLRPLLEE